MAFEHGWRMAMNAETKTTNLIAPNDTVYAMPSEAAAKAILSDFDQMAQRIDRFETLEREAWLGAKEDALLQASAEFLDHFKKRDALMRSKKAMGERLV